MSGCGSSTAKVSGKVYYNGTLLKGGNVTFISSEGKPTVSAAIQADGTYTLPRAPTGKVKICVDTSSLNPATKTNAPKYGPPAGFEAPRGRKSGNAADTADRYTWVPAHYADPDSSDLAYEVKGGNQEHDIQLKEGPVP